MPCTTILVGKNASYNGSTMIARNDDAPANHFMPKKLGILNPGDQPQTYKSVLSHVEIELPASALRCTYMPNAVTGEGIWGAAGVNEENITMTATETITSNSRVLGADPLVTYEPAVIVKEKKADGTEVDVELVSERAGGIGEEDIVMLVLPYIHSAREGVVRLGHLLETYGTYEMNGIAFADLEEIWWLETIGGHHWIARRVPDDAYVMMPNQLGIDYFDLADACGEQKEFMCSADLREFMTKYHLDLTLRETDAEDRSAYGPGNFGPDEFNPRDAFGSHSDQDHIYNTPRAWYMLRYFNPHEGSFDGPDADFRPEDDDLPWCMTPEKKITVEDVKYALSSHYQGTPFDPYGSYGDERLRGKYRSIGINRTDFLSLQELRPEKYLDMSAVEWIAYASNALNTFVPFYANVSQVPEYLACTDGEVTTESFYWASRLVAALADASHGVSIPHVERYQMSVMSKARNIINRCDDVQRTEADPAMREEMRIRANNEIALMLKKETGSVLDKVLRESSSGMRNAFSRSDN